MKTRLVIFFFAFVFMSSMAMTNAFGWCPQNEDWPDAPCYAQYQATSESFQDKIKEDWAKYYDYKGEYWMEQKRYEMEQSIQNNSLGTWVDLAESHQNVHEYYYLQGKSPDLNGKYIFICNLYEDIHRYEEILVQDVVLKKFLEKFPHSTSSSGGIDESGPPQSHIFYEYDEPDVYASLLMRVLEGKDTVPCIVPIAYTLTYSDGSTDMEIRNLDGDTDEILEFLDSLYSYLSPLKQFKSGVPIDEINCREDLVKVIKKFDNMPTCIKSESKSKLIQRDWIKFQFSFCGTDGFDSKGNLNKSNSTHHWDENECDWEYVGPAINSINKWSGDVPENDKWCDTELIVKTKEKIDREVLKLILLDEIAKFGTVYDMPDRDILLTDMGENKTKISMDGSWRLKQDRPDIVKALTELIFVDHVEEYHGRLLVVSCQ